MLVQPVERDQPLAGAPEQPRLVGQADRHEQADRRPTDHCVLEMACERAHYARNHLLYIDYSGRDKATRVVEYRVNPAGTGVVLGSARQLLVVQQPTGPLSDVHKAGQLAFGPDGFLYVSLGDGQCCDDPAGRAQNMDLLLGKLLRLDVNARPPAPQIVALGLRNPWRFSFDRTTGDRYVADVGAGLWGRSTTSRGPSSVSSSTTAGTRGRRTRSRRRRIRTRPGS